MGRSGTHARTQGIVKGMLIVEEDLPKHLKQSMFEKAGEYHVVCRYSSEPGDPGLDVRAQTLMQLTIQLWLIKEGSHTTTTRFCHESL